MSEEDKSGPPQEAEPTSERIAKRLARAGVASRRDAEAMIAEGRVRVNGRVLASPALNVTSADRIEIDGEPIPETERTRLFLFHKPAGVVTTNRDPEGRRTVFDILPEGTPRLMTVGRLDIATEGLLLLTNDGGLARQLELPATGWLRRYRVRVHGKVDETALAGLKDGIAVDGVYYGAVEASLDRVQGSNAWLTLGLREGKNREVRNILGALGLEVSRLIRVSYGPFQLGELEERELREIKGRTLRDQLGEKLIAAAGADFDAPVVNAFSNKPVKAEEKVVTRDAPVNRKREREERREDALDRLSTKPMRGGGDRKPARAKPGFGEPAPKRRDDATRPRASNVWMAPGARPKGPEAKARDAERAERMAAEGREPRPRGDRPAGKPRADNDGRPSRGPRSAEGRPPRRQDGAPRPGRGEREDRREGKPFAKPRRADDARPSGRGEGGDRPARKFDGPRPAGGKPRPSGGPRGDRDARPGPKGGAGDRPARNFDGPRPPAKGPRPAAGKGRPAGGPKDGGKPGRPGPKGPGGGAPRGRGNADRRR